MSHLPEMTCGYLSQPANAKREPVDALFTVRHPPYLTGDDFDEIAIFASKVSYFAPKQSNRPSSVAKYNRSPAIDSPS